MRILLLNYEWPPLGGGAGFASERLARGLAARGRAVDVVTVRPAGSPDEDGSGPDGTTRGGGQPKLHWVRAYRKGMHQAGMTGAAAYVLLALPVARRLLMARRHDVVHVFFSLPTGLLVPLLPLRDAAVVVSLRGSDVPGYDPTNVRLRTFHRLLGPLTRAIWSRADAVVAVCESLAHLAESHHPGNPVTVIPNGVDLELFRPAPARVRQPQAPVRCLTVARLVKRKAVADLLRAWASFERGSYRLEVVGTGEQERELRDLARRLGLGTDVEFTGPLEHDRLAERYRRADIFVLCPVVEAFGNAFAEALASGLPVVGSDVGGVAELVQDGVNGLLVPPGRPEAIAAAVHRLGRDPALRARMGEAARRRAVTHLSWERMTVAYQALYDRLLSRRGTRGGWRRGGADAVPAGRARPRPADRR